ncbi:kinase-like domain-containing protein [Aspergillus desertorum]
MKFSKFTRGRFIVDEAENLRKREIRFDMNSLARVAAESVGAARCISIEKYPDGMFNKAFLMSMDDGREVIAKVPNPNAGVPHFTTGSEVATMDFARKILNTPAPRVHTWNSQAKSHPVGAEFIIIDKIEGVPLSQVWGTMKLPQKLQVLLAMTRFEKQWLSVSFSHYGSLYYTEDVQPLRGNHSLPLARLQAGIGVTQADQIWTSRKGHVRYGSLCSCLVANKFTGASLTQYLQAVGTREVKAIQSLEPPKSTALFCGPKLYRPDTEKKLTALAWYRQVVDALIPKDTAITRPCLWHNDLHDDNVFVDPHNPEKITGIIEWQSYGLEPETLDLVPRPNLSGLSPEEQSAAVHEYTIQNVFIGWRKLMRAKNQTYTKKWIASQINQQPQGLLVSIIQNRLSIWHVMYGCSSSTTFDLAILNNLKSRISLQEPSTALNSWISRRLNLSL